MYWLMQLLSFAIVIGVFMLCIKLIIKWIKK